MSGVELGPALQWAAFILMAAMAIAGALGMATTMSMFRSGIFLMASFLGVAGLFILLLADLLALLQVMMYIGGMLVMILFMVLFSHDPGGAMMAGMKMSPIERLFTLGVPSADSHQKGKDSGGKQNPAMGEMVGGNQSAGQDGPSKSGQQEHGQQGEDPTQMGGMKGEGHGQAGDSGKMQHGGMDMSMTTSIKPLAIAVGLLTTIFLAALMILRPAWQLSEAAPNTNSAQQAGNMLMGKYMMAFEGAGLLILVGIFGAVLLARAGRFPDTSNREAEVAVDGKPAPIETEALEPLRGEPLDLEPEAAPEIHADKRS